MIPRPPGPAGIALACDTEGRVLEILSDQLGVADHFPTGHMFHSGFAPGSMAKSLSFLQQLRSDQAAFDWELQIAAENGAVSNLCFDGCIAEGRLLILGASSRQDLFGFLDDMMRVQNEQVNWIRSGLKEMSLKQPGAGRFQHDLFNELTRLNNELANTQRELAKQNVELQRLNQLKTQFLGMAAHDLRSPIGHILSYSEFLRAGAAPVLSAEQLEFLSIIRSSSEFMLQLIDDFLDVSSIESGHLRLNRGPSDVRTLLEHNVLLNAVLAQKKQILVTLQVEGGLSALSLDEGKIIQVLNNLISNAVKFSRPLTAVVVRAVAEGGGVEISVRDHGPGIPAGELGKLFQPFGKTSVLSTAGESSTGLGLAIARKIVEGHGGRIWVKSQVGVGSVFLFTLPA